ncbi:trehalose 6-phosphate phosphatase [Aminobacter sp. J44]|nr:trehalose 6-phosphate phosphatase [Aminobacter sp. J44]
MGCPFRLNLHFNAMHKKDSLLGASASRRANSYALPTQIASLAVFLDIDGTLLDIASTPEAVVVPPGMPFALARMSERLDGALALVTGRPIEFVDRLFPDAELVVSGLHGAEWRDGSGNAGRVKTTSEFNAGKLRLRQEVARWPGVVFEDKGAAFAAHYRLAPEREMPLRDLMQDLTEAVGSGWVLQEGKQVLELRPRGRDKGDALMAFMEAEPFSGRQPLAMGDDVTDEPMFMAANRLDGLSVRVGEDCRQSCARYRVASPSDVRAWIERASA